MKYFSLLLSLTLLLTVSACSLKKTDTPTTSSTQNEILSKGMRFGDKQDPLAQAAEALKPAIDKWLEEGMKNETLNEWGEPFGSLPPTTQQLMDPYTKKPSTKYEWIIRRHGDLLVQWGKEVEEMKK